MAHAFVWRDDEIGASHVCVPPSLPDNIIMIIYALFGISPQTKCMPFEHQYLIANEMATFRSSFTMMTSGDGEAVSHASIINIIAAHFVVLAQNAI